MKKLYLIIGAPGSGKTTDAEIIAKNNENISHYSTGDMLRAEVARGTELGKKIQTYISQGLIVPIEIAIETITQAIKNAPTEIVIIDGYPRSIEQLEALNTFLQNDATITLVRVIEVRVSEATARDRVLGRARGADDDEKVFNNRMNVYEEPLEDIRRFYIQKGVFEVVSGEGTIEEIVKKMETLIN